MNRSPSCVVVASAVHFAPSDALPDSSFTLAGRVLALEGRSIALGDAFAVVNVAIVGRVEVGDLVVLRATRDQSGHLHGEIVERHTPPSSRAQTSESETGRLATGVGANLRAREKALAAIRAFFAERRFLEVETPSIVPSPGLDLHLDAFDVPSGGYLITSPEYQMKRLLAGGVPRCFQLSHCFRKGEVGDRHNPEFTMLEWYRAFSSVETLMRDTEALVVAVARALGNVDHVRVEGRNVRIDHAFGRITVGEAFAQFAGVPEDDAIRMATDDEDRFFRLLVERVEPALASFASPVFLHRYPAPFASLARLCPDDPRVAERFELYAGGVELCNGFGELTNPTEQRARLEHDQRERARRSLPVYPIDERFLAALEEGMPPSAGNALGVDRLIAISLGERSIANVTAFPFAWLS